MNSDSDRRKGFRVGLTGGIACGKSNILVQFQKLGAAVIDADRIARTVVEPGRPAYLELIQEFGPEILNPDRTLDRRRLAARVFSDEEARTRLNHILHPRILAEEDLLLDIAEEAGARLVVVDAALMVEAGTFHRYGVIIVAFCPPSVQIERVVRRDRLSREDAMRRIESQISIFRKLKYADYVINTSGPHWNTAEQVRQVYRELSRLWAF